MMMMMRLYSDKSTNYCPWHFTLKIMKKLKEKVGGGGGGEGKNNRNKLAGS